MVQAPEEQQQQQQQLVQHADPERPSAPLPGDPAVTASGLPVNYRVPCRDCGDLLFLHILPEYFDMHNGGWICDACHLQNPVACSICNGVFPCADLAQSNLLIGGTSCADCLPVWEADMEAQMQ